MQNTTGSWKFKKQFSADDLKNDNLRNGAILYQVREDCMK